jgi:dihydrofolate reductase
MALGQPVVRQGVRVILIAAVSADGKISKGTGVPWELPLDREHFRRLTQGQWLLLGRRTFEEMRGWFRDHRPLVLTHRALSAPWDGAGVATVDEAIRRVEQGGGSELWVCGGGAAYAAALPVATEVILTEVEGTLGEGVAFPDLDAACWREVRRERVAINGPGQARFEWVWRKRVGV